MEIILFQGDRVAELRCMILSMKNNTMDRKLEAKDRLF